MPLQTGSRFPYPEFRKHQAQNQPVPVVWQWTTLAKELEAAEHTEYGTLTLGAPEGSHEIIPGTSITLQAVRPGDRTTPHSHSWWHLYFVQSGSGTVIFDTTRETAELSEGDIMFIPAWIVHHFENRDADGELLLFNMSNLPQLAGLHNDFSKQHV